MSRFEYDAPEWAQGNPFWDEGQPLSPTEVMRKITEDGVPFDGKTAVEACDAWYEMRMLELDVEDQAAFEANFDAACYIESEGFDPEDRDNLPAYVQEKVDSIIGGLSREDVQNQTIAVYNECAAAQDMFDMLSEEEKLGCGSCFGDAVAQQLYQAGVLDEKVVQASYDVPFYEMERLIDSYGPEWYNDGGMSRSNYSVMFSDYLEGVSQLEDGEKGKKRLDAYFAKYDYLEDKLNAGNTSGKKHSLGDYKLYKQMEALGHKHHELGEYDSTILQGRQTSDAPSNVVEFCERTGHVWDRDMQSKVDRYVEVHLQNYDGAMNVVHDEDEARQTLNQMFEGVYAADRKLQGSAIGARSHVRPGAFDNGSRNLHIVGAEMQRKMDELGYQGFCDKKFEQYLADKKAQHVKPAGDRSVPSQEEICPSSGEEVRAFEIGGNL